MKEYEIRTKSKIDKRESSLTERIVKLQIFLSSDEANELEDKMQELLDEQLKIMKNYRDIINSRILLMMK